jgi:hypothetical protein
MARRAQRGREQDPHTAREGGVTEKVLSMKTQIARTLGVRKLYHYRPSNFDWLRQTISENTVHCPSPQDFNDPWDCQPCFDDSVVDDPAERARLVKYFDVSYRKQFPGKPQEEYRQRMDQVSADTNLLRSMVRQLSDMGKAIGEQYRVYCLSKLPDSILMWGCMRRNIAVSALVSPPTMNSLGAHIKSSIAKRTQN